MHDSSEVHISLLIARVICRVFERVLDRLLGILSGHLSSVEKSGEICCLGYIVVGRNLQVTQSIDKLPGKTVDGFSSGNLKISQQKHYLNAG